MPDMMPVRTVDTHCTVQEGGLSQVHSCEAGLRQPTENITGI